MFKATLGLVTVSLQASLTSVAHRSFTEASCSTPELLCAAQANEMDIDDLTPEQRELLKRIQARRVVVVREHRLKKGAGNNQAIVPRRNDPRRISNTQNMKVGGASDWVCRAESSQGPLR